MLRFKTILAKADYGHGVIATYCSATFSKITSQEMVDWITIAVGLLTAIKIIFDIHHKHKGNGTKKIK